jgi:levanase/fructan beta-fructosidase
MKKQLPVFIFCFFLVCGIFAQTNQVPTPQWRPVYHFTPVKNWTNDPNGPIYLNGTFHLYNQQNPFENKWGHMSWGHATSKDLIHWKPQPIAMPEKIDQDTTWRFSGCAVLDKNNTSGLCKNDSCLIAIYTADQPNLKKESQYIAYSNDGGMSFTNYEKNPVIDLHKKDFRDPNVTWNDDLKKWLMVVALPKENQVQFYSSDNLIKWDLLGEFGPAGIKKGIWECPSFIRLPVTGQPNKWKWVLMNSFGGTGKPLMQYFIGDFNGKTFINDNPSDKILYVDYGDCFYAAIPWNNIPDNKNLFIGWMVPSAQQTYPWRGQMSIPRELSLVETKEGIRLAQQPSPMIENILDRLSGKPANELKDIKVSNGEKPVGENGVTKGNAYWIDAELVATPGSTAGFRIAVKKDENNKIISATEIGYNSAKHQWYVDRSHSGSQVNNIKPDNRLQTIDEQVDPDKIKLKILIDKSSLEVFFGDQGKVLTTYIFPDEGSDNLMLFANDGTVNLKSGKIWNLSGIIPGISDK